MSKSVLVIDTPESCSECILREMSHCMITQEMIGNTHCCPLSSLPSPISLRQYVDNAALNIEGMLAYQYAQGYNDCLEEIKQTSAQ